MIPKRHGKDGRSEVTVPVIADRALQSLWRSAALGTPKWEARFEPRSCTGFRPGRGCHDAIEAIYQVGKGSQPGPEVGAGRRTLSGARSTGSEPSFLSGPTGSAVPGQGTWFARRMA